MTTSATNISSSSVSRRHLATTLCKYVSCLALFFLCGCFDNNPYPGQDPDEKTLYYSYAPQVKHLDPVKAYNAGDYKIMRPIYESPFEYHYLYRPARLQGRTALDVPEAVRYGKNDELLAEGASPEDVARVVYTIRLKEGIRYQNHPCFAKDSAGEYLFHLDADQGFPRVMHPDELLGDSAITSATRELHAQDFVHQWKRMANPLLECPVRQVFESVVLGMSDLRETIEAETQKVRDNRREEGGARYNQESDELTHPIYVDLRPLDFEGVKALDKHTLQITLNREYPQLLQWMAISFFAPVPWESSRFYEQFAAAEWNLTLDRYPVGTGPYKLIENRPNYRIVLERNENFRKEYYPSEGDPGDKDAGLLDYAGKQIPFVDRAVFMLDIESPPRWKKFLQGYYDFLELNTGDVQQSQQVIDMTMEGGAGISPDMAARGMSVHEGARPLMRYYAFNMRDPVWGGYTEEKQKMRQAVSIALNMDEYIQIFQNGRGFLCQGPIPIGMFGHHSGEEGINPYVFDWDKDGGMVQRKAIDYAKSLLVEAGYPGGRDADGNQLVLQYDLYAKRGAKTTSDWINKQLGQIGLHVELKPTDANRWQDKLITGNFQFIEYGWGADYPDPENFLFLFYGPNGKVEHHGENYANYSNPEYDALFLKMETMTNSPERQEIIDQMVEMLRRDAPWVFAWQPIDYTIQHEWLKNYKFRMIGGHALKYLDVDHELRAEQTYKWNQAVVWPLWVALFVLVAGIAPVVVRSRRRWKEGVQL